MPANYSSKPERLRPGDRVAVLAPSSGAAARFPHILELGVRNLEHLFSVTVVEFPTARTSNADLWANPRRRAEDINAAFADPEVRAIVATIGGDDSVRILPFLDLPTILAKPKILMGFSDTTTLTSYLGWHGMVTYNGPSIMAGFAQLRHLPATFREHIRRVLAEPESPVEFRPFEAWTERYLDWSAADNDGRVLDLRANDEGWRWLQGAVTVQGRLFGGCIEVLEFMKGTDFWPPHEFFDGRILFFETSEEKPPVSQVKYFLRNYGSMGVLNRVAAILVGRARSYSNDEKTQLYQMLVDVVAKEFGRPDMPIVANLDFGHTDPQWIMPQGILAEIDPIERRLRLLETAVN